MTSSAEARRTTTTTTPSTTTTTRAWRNAWSATTSRTGGGNARVNVGASSRGGWRRRKFAPWEDNAYIDDSTIYLGFMHMGDGTLSVRLVDVEDVGCATIRAN